MDASIQNTTIFVGNVNSYMREDDLYHMFQSFGDITHIKIVPNKACAFVTFRDHQSAADAIREMKGVTIGTIKMRVDWGRANNPCPDAVVYNCGQKVRPSNTYLPMNTNNPYGVNGIVQNQMMGMIPHNMGMMPNMAVMMNLPQHTNPSMPGNKPPVSNPNMGINVINNGYNNMNNFGQYPDMHHYNMGRQPISVLPQFVPLGPHNQQIPIGYSSPIESNMPNIGYHQTTPYIQSNQIQSNQNMNNLGYLQNFTPYQGQNMVFNYPYFENNNIGIEDSTTIENDEFIYSLNKNKQKDIKFIIGDKPNPFNNIIESINPVQLPKIEHSLTKDLFELKITEFCRTYATNFLHFYYGMVRLSYETH